MAQMIVIMIKAHLEGEDKQEIIPYMTMKHRSYLSLRMQDEVTRKTN